MKPGPKRAKKNGHPPKKPKTRKKTAGRLKYVPSESHLKTAQELANKGATHKQIAEALGISISTLKNNKKLFMPPIKKGRESTNPELVQEVVESIQKQSKGYFVEEEDWYETNGKEGAVGKPVKHLRKKWIPGNVVAAMFYVVNKDPTNWRSINRDAKGSDDNRGKIAQFFDEMRSGYKKKLEEDGPDIKG